MMYNQLAPEDAINGAYLGEPMEAPILATETLTDAVTSTMSRTSKGITSVNGSVVFVWLVLVGALVVMHVMTLRWQS